MEVVAVYDGDSRARGEEGKGLGDKEVGDAGIRTVPLKRRTRQNGSTSKTLVAGFSCSAAGRSPSPLLLLVAAAGLLLLLTPASAGAAENEKKEKKVVGMRMRVADEEEARWMDRFAETHQPLGTPGQGPLLFRRATAEEARIMDLDGKNKHKEDAAGDGNGGGRGNVLEFDQDNPYFFLLFPAFAYYHALQAWVKRLIKESGGIKIVDDDGSQRDYGDLF
ncbi:hypothetical protein EJB05_03119, partial [Eragrostis curvula]